MLEAQQFDDTESGRFFMRVVFDPGEASADALRSAWRPLRSNSPWTGPARHHAKRRTMLMVRSSTTAWAICSIARGSANCRWTWWRSSATTPRKR
jgi:formyltetrahydrofolate hydrolase